MNNNWDVDIYISVSKSFDASVALSKALTEKAGWKVQVNTYFSGDLGYNYCNDSLLLALYPCKREGVKFVINSKLIDSQLKRDNFLQKFTKVLEETCLPKNKNYDKKH